MRFTTSQYLISFTLYIFFSTSVVVAIPTNGRAVYTQVAKRAPADVDFTSSSLHRRAKGPTTSKTQSVRASKRLVPPTMCPLPAKRNQGLIKRQYIHGELYARLMQEGSTEMTIQGFDPQYTHKVLQPLTMHSEHFLAIGSAGTLYVDPAHPNVVIKHLQSRNGYSSASSSGGSSSGGSASSSSMSLASGSSGGSYKVTDETVILEVMGLMHVGQFIDYKYTLKGGKMEQAWIYTHKVPGIPLSGLGFSMKLGGAVRTADTDFAKAHGLSRVNGVSPAARIDFLDKVKSMTEKVALDLAQSTGIHNIDLSPNNIMIKLEADGEIVLITIIDWQLWECADDTVQAKTKKELDDSLGPYY